MFKFFKQINSIIFLLKFSSYLLKKKKAVVCCWSLEIISVCLILFRPTSLRETINSSQLR